MTWREFLVAIAAFYLVYYTMNIIYDLLCTPTAEEKALGDEALYFTEHIPPELILPSEDKASEAESDNPANISNGESVAIPGFSSGPIQASGGVSMKEMIGLAKANAFEFTKAIPY
ncbi:hypothetical protein [Pedobacter aquatilis]|uniref:hypothetical protein n=1 Tax=Pedobacter aquatilis TaxID=351343 RepID=UPI00292D8D0D|nr:hypothetical protein [Pedobacter aquatilis]